MSKTELHTVCGQVIELDDSQILCNDITFPWDFNPHNTRLWIVCNEYGALGAVWAQHEQDALDELVDNDLGAGLLVDEADADDDECARLGNAGEPADLSNCRLYVVKFCRAGNDAEIKDSCKLLCRFAEARGAGADTLDDI